MVIELPADVSSPALARRFVLRSFSGSGVEDLTDVVVLLVSELVTNAVLHARSDSVLKLSHERERLRVELHDASTEGAVVVGGDERGGGAGGRGVLLVDALADRWGSDRDERGKTVWFELAAPSPPG